MQVLQPVSQREADSQAFGKSQTAARTQIGGEGTGSVRIRTVECGVRSAPGGALAGFRIAHSALRTRIIRQLHDIIKVTSRFVDADLENIYQPFMAAGERLEF